MLVVWFEYCCYIPVCMKKMRVCKIWNITKVETVFAKV